MHYFYYLLDPLYVLLNYLFSMTPWVFLIVLVILCISHCSILRFRGKVLWEIWKKRTIAGKQVWHITTTTLHLHLAKYKTAFSEQERSVFSHKVGNMLRGLFLICFGRTLVSVLFWSFVSTGWVNNAEHSYSLLNNVEFFLGHDIAIDLTEVDAEKVLIKTDFGDKALVAIDPSSLQKIDFTLGYLAIYMLFFLTLAGYFFLISLWNSFLKNVGRFFVTGVILLHLAWVLFATYTHLWTTPIA